MRLALLFPGQGAQAVGLGVPWLGLPAWSAAERIDEQLDGAATRLLLKAEADELRRTEEAQLCVLAASLVAYTSLTDAGMTPCLPAPVVMAGHSLGQITALIAAGALDFEAGVQLAGARARHTQAAADANPGRLAALLGATLETAEAACAAAPDACWIANDNAPGQVVIGGTADGVATASDAARAAGVRKVTELAVGGAFHTPLMQPAADALATDLAAATFSTPTAPIVANTDGGEHTDPAGWPERLTNHLVQPVRWRSSLERMAAMGVDTFVEVGPGGVLAGLVKRTLPGAAIHVVAGPADIDRLAALMLEGVNA
jgi:[acyl-carrier-protein] S-malonyltransferase